MTNCKRMLLTAVAAAAMIVVLAPATRRRGIVAAAAAVHGVARTAAVVRGAVRMAPRAAVVRAVVRTIHVEVPADASAAMLAKAAATLVAAPVDPAVRANPPPAHRERITIATSIIKTRTAIMHSVTMLTIVASKLKVRASRRIHRI